MSDGNDNQFVGASEEEQAKLLVRKEDEKTKERQIQKIKIEIESLEELGKQPVELAEEQELKDLEKQVEEMERL